MTESPEAPSATPVPTSGGEPGLGKRLRAARAAIYLAFVFVLALGIRVWWVRHWIIANYPDQPSLEQYAANVAHGLYYGTHGAYWPPAFIFLAGFIERWFGTGHQFLAVRETNALLGALAVLLTADIARRIARSPEAGLVAGILAALFAPAIYYTDTFLNATLDALMLVAVIDAVIVLGDAAEPTARLLTLNGLLLGIATLTKETLLPLIVPAVLYWGTAGRWPHRWRKALAAGVAVLALALLVNVPWTIRNLRVTGSAVFVDVNGGVNWLIAHNPQSTGQWMNLGNNNPILLRGSGYDRPNTNRYAMQAGMRYFEAHPVLDLHQAVRVFALFWTERDPDLATYGSSLAPITRDLHLPLIRFSLLRDIGLLGMLGLIPAWRRGFLVPLTLLGFSGGLALLFFAPRFRLPVDPLLMVSAAAGVVALVRWAYRSQAGEPDRKRT